MALTVFAGLCMCFLFTIILASVHMDDQGDDDGDLFSGSGNGTGSRPCTAGETTRSNFTSSKNSLSSVTLEALCYSLCVNEYSLAESLANEYHMSMLSSAELRANCSFYNQVYLCQEGCELNQLISETCSSDCYESCKSHKLYLPDSLCTISCLRDVCKKGCQLYEEMNTTEDMIPAISDHNFSLLPFSSPYLHVPGAYQFLYNASSFQLYFADTLVSFILQVKPVSSNIDASTVYYWLSSNDAVFVIDPYFLCEEVKISFALVNEFGRGNFSNPILLTVYGNDYPELPDHPSLDLIQWTVEDDTRMDHWEQAIVNISWQQPHNVRYATGYRIVIEPLFLYCCCFRQIHINDSSVLLATWEGGDSPLNNCTYDLKILSLPYNSQYGLPDSLTIEISTKGTNMVPKDYLIDLLFVGSQRVALDSDHYQIYSFMFSWSLPAQPFLTTGIFGFNLHLKRPSSDSKSVLFVHNNGSLNYSIELNNVHSINEGLLLFELETEYYKGAPEAFRFIKRNFTVSFDGRPFPPPPPAYITISDISFSNNDALILFKMSWAAEPLPYDRRNVTNSREYYVHIGLEPLTNELATSLPLNGTVYWANTSSLPLHSNYIFYSFHKVFVLMIFDDYIIEGALPLQSESWTLYIQVARVNVPSRRPGRWSHPSTFRVSNSNYIRSTTTINSATTTRMLSTSSLPIVTAVVIVSPDYNLYYYSIIIVFFALSLLAVALFGIACVYKEHRNFKRQFVDK